jgi:hypothetical protein
MSDTGMSMRAVAGSALPKVERERGVVQRPRLKVLARGTLRSSIIATRYAINIDKRTQKQTIS